MEDIMLRNGDMGAKVSELKQMLKLLQYRTAEGTNIFDGVTMHSVIAFQNDHGLPVSGAVDGGTWLALQAALRKRGEGLIPKQNKEEKVPTAARETAAESPSAMKEENANGRNHNEETAPFSPPKKALRGKEARLLQRKLSDLGYYNCAIDGEFGEDSQNALKSFQRDNGLTEDGLPGPETRTALENALLPRSFSPPAVKEGDSGDAVTILQWKLKRLDGFPGSVTGVFGRETKEALKAFQSKNGLSPDGGAGTETWKKLLGLTADPEGEKTPPGGLRQVLRLGDSGDHVMLLQKQLSGALHYEGPLSGVFDKKTLLAVKTFQDANRLTPDGVVGRATWFSLLSD